MSLVSASTINYNFADGKTLFSDLSFAIEPGVTVLVGSNGSGKSILAELLSGALQPCSGSFIVNGSLGYFKQQADVQELAHQSIADVLGITSVLTSLNRIYSGDYNACDLDTVAGQWNLQKELNDNLEKLGITAGPNDSCANLSGGQLARLQLSLLFQQKHQILILDEPSNHLDQTAKNWLKHQINDFSGSILLITHDQDFLENISQFLILNSQGIESFTGSYQQLMQNQLLLEKRLNKKFNNAKSLQKKLAKTQQKSIEAAQQRRKQGQRLRDNGSQAKVILDMAKMSAEKSISQQKTRARKANFQAQETINTIKNRQEILPPISIDFSSSNKTSSIKLCDILLPFGTHQLISFELASGEKLALQGDNGAGKSTLLKVIAKQLHAKSGNITHKGSTFYIDQYFSALIDGQSILENVLKACPNIIINKARALLASIGFRAESVMIQAGNLSGGEKMRLTLLIAGNQAENTLLLLDEPDNHLDVATKKQLADAINRYKGGFILVSHNAGFIKSTGVTRSYHLE